MSTYRPWKFSSVSFQQHASQSFCTSWDAFFVPWMDAYGGYLLSRYGGIFWVIKEYLFLIQLLIRIQKHDQQKNIQVIWLQGKGYSNIISETCHGSVQKEKYYPCYLKYKVLNENWIFLTKAFNKTAKQIVQLFSRTFGCSPHFIKAFFSAYYFILFSCSVIYFIARILGYKLGLARIPKYPDHRPRRWHPDKNYCRGYWYKHILF